MTCELTGLGAARSLPKACQKLSAEPESSRRALRADCCECSLQPSPAGEKSLRYWRCFARCGSWLKPWTLSVLEHKT